MRGVFPTGPGGARPDVVVVGAGPAGSVAALVLARGGARVALVDKASFPRDKACGDLVGPRGVQVLVDLGLAPVPGAVPVGDMDVLGPTGRRALLPARPGRTYPGHALAVPRRRFDAWLRDAALAAGVEPVVGRATLTDDGVVLDGGRRLRADVVVGADGALSAIGAAAGLVREDRALWGFALRTYSAGALARPVIALWDEQPRRGFPGYGWAFPGEPGRLNVGLGVGTGHGRAGGERPARRLGAFLAHLRRLEVLDGGGLDPGRLGGWLRMGLAGTVPARGRVLLVGDAAGLVNPLQGEGIAQALASGRAAAEAVLAGTGTAAEGYRQWVARTYEPYASVTTPVHAALVGGPRRVSAIGRLLTAPPVAHVVAPVWALYWNDLLAGARPSAAATGARAVQTLGRLVTLPTRTRRQLHHDLAGPAGAPGFSAHQEHSAPEESKTCS